MLDAVKQQIIATCRHPDGPLLDVFGAIEYAALKDRPPSRMPAAYVIPLGESAEPSRQMTGRLRQNASTRFAVMLVISSTGAPLGDKDLVKTICDQVRSAVFGFEPGGIYGQIEYRRGLLADLSDGVIWWQLDFVSEFLISDSN